MVNHAGRNAQHDGFLFFQMLAEKTPFQGKSASIVQVIKTKTPHKTLIHNALYGVSCSPTRTTKRKIYYILKNHFHDDIQLFIWLKSAAKIK